MELCLLQLFFHFNYFHHSCFFYFINHFHILKTSLSHPRPLTHNSLDIPPSFPLPFSFFPMSFLLHPAWPIPLHDMHDSPLPHILWPSNPHFLLTPSSLTLLRTPPHILPLKLLLWLVCFIFACYVEAEAISHISFSSSWKNIFSYFI